MMVASRCPSFILWRSTSILGSREAKLMLCEKNIGVSQWLSRVMMLLCSRLACLNSWLSLANHSKMGIMSLLPLRM